MKECSFCGNKLERGQDKYCSRSCRNKANPRKAKELPHIEIKCEVCGNTFLATRKDRIYCSESCNYKARKLRYQQKPKNGQTIWRKNRKEIFKHQNGFCWLCKCPMDSHRFDVHHLQNDHNFLSEDIVAVHKECHNKFHKITIIIKGKDVVFQGEILEMLRNGGFNINGCYK